MDVLSHGLWGGAAFATSGKKRFWAAILMGMAPDLSSFGVFHLMRPGWMVSRMAGEVSGPPAIAILPAYVFYAYNVTHSLVICAVVSLLLWNWLKSPPWLMAPWALHIVCDIPTHGTSYFPTPFLWPLPTPFVDGVSWATPQFMAANYASLAAVYGMIFWYRRRKKRSSNA